LNSTLHTLTRGDLPRILTHASAATVPTIRLFAEVIRPVASALQGDHESQVVDVVVPRDADARSAIAALVLQKMGGGWSVVSAWQPVDIDEF
jgi:rhodanese-related sulfurtransferase